MGVKIEYGVAIKNADISLLRIAATLAVVFYILITRFQTIVSSSL